MKIKFPIFLIVSILSFCIFGRIAYAKDIPKLYIFHSPSCHRCIEVKAEVLPKIEKEFKDKVIIEYYNTDELQNYKLMIALREKYDPEFKIILPVFFIQGKFSNGAGDVENNLRLLIRRSQNASDFLIGELPHMDLLQRFKGFKLFTVLGAALVDGINPCAFTVIVFFVSFLTLQGYRKKELLAIGLSFIFSVFLTYLFIGFGLFSFLYRLKSFTSFTKVFNFCMGIFSILLGIFAFYDFFKFRTTRQTEGLLLQLPKSIKNQIHSVIGLHYRKSKDKNTNERAMAKLIVSALITGCLVSLFESVCTGQLYLPTISFVLKTSNLKLQALVYLIFYNLVFVTPLVIIFILALLGVTSEDFSRFLKRHILTVKILMAGLFFGLGIFLIWRG